MVLLYMVCHGSHQYTPFMLALIYQHHGSVMGDEPLYQSVESRWGAARSSSSGTARAVDSQLPAVVTGDAHSSQPHQPQTRQVDSGKPLISLNILNPSGMFQPIMGESYWYWYSYPLFWWWIYSFITCYVLLYVSSFPSLYFLTVGGSLVLCCFTSNVLGIPRRIFSLLGFDWNSWQPGPSCILEQLFWSGTAFLELPRVKWFVQGYQFTTYYLLRLTNKFDIFQELKGKS